MTKLEHKKMIEIVKVGSMKKAFYFDYYCGTYTKSWSNAEIKENVYNELKKQDMLYK